MKIEIDAHSGFCHGVTTAIKKAEKELQDGGYLASLGDIVHNGGEVERLRELGLETINHEEFSKMKNTRVLLRAHGEPPETYNLAARNNITLVDATCPVVLQLQKRIKSIYTGESTMPQIVIYGKKGHAEVIGLVGQTAGEAVVVQSIDEAKQLDFKRDICLFSQTTMPLDGFHKLIEFLNASIQAPATFRYFDTICRQVANRLPNIRDFAARHDVIVFVSGLKSSNGKVLYAACKDVNSRSYMVDTPASICFDWFEGVETVGICGATSTPYWLMEACRKKIATLR